MEQTDYGYLQLLGSMSIEASHFASTIKDNVIASGYRDLHKHMVLAFDIPDKVSFGFKAFPAKWLWKVVELGERSWPYGTDKKVAHPKLGEFPTKTIAVTEQGDLALVLSGTSGFAPKKYQWRTRHKDLSLLKDYETQWSPPVLKQINQCRPELSQFIVHSDNADTPEKRQEVLSAWRQSLHEAYTNRMNDIENTIRDQSFKA